MEPLRIAPCSIEHSSIGPCKTRSFNEKSYGRVLRLGPDRECVRKALVNTDKQKQAPDLAHRGLIENDGRQEDFLLVFHLREEACIFLETDCR